MTAKLISQEEYLPDSHIFFEVWEINGEVIEQMWCRKCGMRMKTIDNPTQRLEFRDLHVDCKEELE